MRMTMLTKLLPSRRKSHMEDELQALVDGPSEAEIACWNRKFRRSGTLKEEYAGDCGSNRLQTEDCDAPWAA